MRGTALAAVVVAMVFAAPAAALTRVGAVYYSGEGAAGASEATGAAFRYVANDQYLGNNYDGIWTERGVHCGTTKAAQFPASKGGLKITQLSGWSLGRLGPGYFLKQAPQRASQINYILLVDPGNYEDSVGGCEQTLNFNSLLANWLTRSSANRLVIMSGSLTTMGDPGKGPHTALADFYLKDIQDHAVAAQVLVCDAKLDHDATMAEYSGLVGLSAPSKCPGGSTQWRLHVPPQGQPPAGGGSGGAPSGSGSGGSGEGTGSGGVPVSPPGTVGETSGSVVHTWSDAADAGGTEGPSIPSNDTVQIVCKTTGFQVADGNTWWYVVASSPWNSAYYGSADAFYNNGATSGGLVGTPWVDTSVPDCPGTVDGPTGPAAPAPPPPTTYAETPGSVVHTWTDFSDAGGNEGPTVPSNQTIQIACKITGFAVADGDTWWYRIASSPWNDSYYGSADAFYNDGATSGSLKGTPFADENVPNC